MNTDLLELYSDYLLSAFGYTTATGLSKMTNGVVSHDKITRFLAGKELNSSELWRLVKPLVREVEDEASGVLVIDDTIEEKPYTPTRASSSAGTTTTVKAETSKA